MNPIAPKPLTKYPSRMVIFAKDIIILQQCSASSASRKIKEVKLHYSKNNHQQITIREYCEYCDLPYQETCEFLHLI